MLDQPTHIVDARSGGISTGSALSLTCPSAAHIELSDWKGHWANLSRIGCATDLVESDITQLRALLGKFKASRGASPLQRVEHEDIHEVMQKILRIDGDLSRLSLFMGGLPARGFSRDLVGKAFSDPLYQYFRSARTVADFFAFKEETALASGYAHLHAELFSQEIGRYVEQLQSFLQGYDYGKGHKLSTEDAEAFVNMLLEPLVFFPTPHWVEVVHICKKLVDVGMVEQTSLCALTQTLVQGIASRDASTSSSDGIVEALCAATSSLQGALSPEVEKSLYDLGTLRASTRCWGDIFENPSIESNELTEFGYCVQLLHRLSESSVEDKDRIKNLIQGTLHHPSLAYFTPNSSSWYSDGVTRAQSALVAIMQFQDPDIAQESLHAAHWMLWSEWKDLGLLWQGANVGMFWGDAAVQHTFLGYVLQNPDAVASLKGFLYEATSPLGATYHFVSGLRQVIRDRHQGLTTATYRTNTLRALELLAHTGGDGLAAAPEVFGLLGIAVFKIPFGGPFVSPPWSKTKDSDSGVRRWARTLVKHWEDKYGPLSTTISRKLARYDRAFAEESTSRVEKKS